MSVILPTAFTINNIDYNTLFASLEPQIMVEIKKIAKAEAVGNKPNMQKVQEYLAAINYVYSLHTISLYSQDLNYWKDKMDYESIKNCFNLKSINLDTLLALIET